MQEILERLLGIGFGATVAVVVAIYVVRNAIAKAVELAGQKELERLKGDLARELEDKRAAF